MKKIFYTELAYIIGLFTLALGTALMERANFGMWIYSFSKMDCGFFAGSFIFAFAAV